MPLIFDSPDDLIGKEGTVLGPTDWEEISQDRINMFAEATGDYQWIHTDPVKAQEGPFGSTVAHGYLTLALTNLFLPSLLQVTNISMGINYGTNRVRFPNPARVGSDLRAVGTISAVEEISGGIQVVITVTVEINGEPKPACVVESISRFMR